MTIKKSRSTVKKSHKHHKAHVIGTIKPEKIKEFIPNPTLEVVLPVDEPPVEIEAIPEEEHVLAAIPKSTWERIKDAMGW